MEQNIVSPEKGLQLEEPEQREEKDTGLAGAVDRILDKGLVINADVIVNVDGTELLGIKIRAALASFETAAEYGLEFPTGTKETVAHEKAKAEKEKCPQCGKRVERKQLLEEQCPWCGWTSFKAREKEKEKEKIRPERT